MATTLHRCWEKVKVTVFKVTGWHPLDRSDDSDVAGKLYDAFLSHHHNDSQFVIRLLPALENQEPHYRLYVPDRDFMAGTLITEAIAGGVNSSQRTIVLLSNDFITSDRCMLEFR